MTKEAPSPEKVKAVLTRLRRRPWLVEYCMVLAETGMRPTELLGLRTTDVRDKLVSIVPWEGRQLKSKGSKRTIEVNDVAAEVLRRRNGTRFARTARSSRIGWGRSIPETGSTGSFATPWRKNAAARSPRRSG